MCPLHTAVHPSWPLCVVLLVGTVVETRGHGYKLSGCLVLLFEAGSSGKESKSSSDTFACVVYSYVTCCIDLYSVITCYSV